MQTPICAIILAAGTSSRMGKPKQTLLLGKKTILEHVIHYSLAENFSEIITIIGYKAAKIQKRISIDDHRFRWVVNKDFRLGQSTSLKKGIENMQEHHSNVMVFLGDLPIISAETISLIYQSGVEMCLETNKPFIIQPHNSGVPGHPVFFGNISKVLFMKLEGDKGAKSIMNKVQQYKRLDVMDQGILFDVDTPEAYEKVKEVFRMKNC